MDPKLDHLVNCIQALEFERKLTYQLSGRVLGALCVKPQSHLVGAFQDCILLYNERFTTTWAVDEEYLKQLEHIIWPWFTYWSKSHGYRLFSRAAVEEFRGRFGCSYLLPLCIAVLLELEYLNVDPQVAVENYHGIFKTLQSQLGQSLFDTVFSVRFSKLSDWLSLDGYGAVGVKRSQTQTLEREDIQEYMVAQTHPEVLGLETHKNSVDSLNQTDACDSPSKEDPMKNDIPHLELVLRCEVLSSSLSEDERAQASPSIDGQSSVTEDQPPFILVHSVPAEDIKQRQGRQKKHSNAARHSAGSASARLCEDSGLFEESFSPFEDKPGPDIFNFPVSPEREEPNTGQPKDADCMARLENMEATIQMLSLEITRRDEIIVGMKAREEALRETLASVLQVQGPPKTAPRPSLSKKDPPKPKPRTVLPGHPSHPLSTLQDDHNNSIPPDTTQHLESNGEDRKPNIDKEKDNCDEHLYMSPHSSSGVQHFSHVSLNMTPISRSQSENPLSCLNSGLAKDTHSHSATSGLQAEQTPNFNIDQKLGFRWSQPARSFFQDKDQRTLDWKQRLRRLGKSWKAKFKPSSVTRSVPSLVGHELPVTPDFRTIPREGAKPPENLKTIPREGAEPPENLKTIPREGAKPSEMQAGVQASDDCKAAFSNSKCPIFDGVGSSATGGEHTHVLKAEPSNEFKKASKVTPSQHEVEHSTCPLPQKS